MEEFAVIGLFTVLVIGASGFVGYHVGQDNVRDDFRNCVVIAMDFDRCYEHHILGEKLTRTGEIQ
jgi:nucleoside-diphosphate-sugar epimerase